MLAGRFRPSLSAGTSCLFLGSGTYGFLWGSRFRTGTKQVQTWTGLEPNKLYILLYIDKELCQMRPDVACISNFLNTEQPKTTQNHPKPATISKSQTNPQETIHALSIRTKNISTWCVWYASHDCHVIFSDRVVIVSASLLIKLCRYLAECLNTAANTRSQWKLLEETDYVNNTKNLFINRFAWC